MSKSLPSIGPSLTARGWRLVRWSNNRATYSHDRSGAVVETRGNDCDGKLEVRINTGTFRRRASIDGVFDEAVAKARARKRKILARRHGRR